ncbi:unnamed protein product [Cuscuta campestris]|uniref:Uncharacterized protein n=1 Tax=Cuscuta campestris TaxID=132261 RepID=A0A484KRG9_9ASTE|nr:unnamed protein product [Cuscuta campestris]
MVRSLTNRRFTHGHVAQMKFILPEVIEKIKDDLITINPSAVVNEGDVKSGSANIGLWNIFRKRLLDFFEAHPEVLTVLLPVYIVFG